MSISLARSEKAPKQLIKVQSLLISFAAIMILLPLLICVFVYIFCFRLITEQTMAMQADRTASGIVQFNNSLAYVDSYSYTLGECAEVRAFLSTPAEPRNELANAVRKVYYAFPYFSDINHLADNIWLYNTASTAARSWIETPATWIWIFSILLP